MHYKIFLLTISAATFFFNFNINSAAQPPRSSTQECLTYDSESDHDETGMSTEGNNPKSNGVSLAQNLLLAASENDFEGCKELLTNPETNLRYSGRQTEGISVMMHLFENFMRNPFSKSQIFDENHKQHEEIFQLALRHKSFTMMRQSKRDQKTFFDDIVNYGLDEAQHTEYPPAKVIFIAGVLRGLVQLYQADPSRLHEETKTRLGQSCKKQDNQNPAYSQMLQKALCGESILSPQRLRFVPATTQALAIWPRPTAVPNAQAAAESSTITEPTPLLTQPALPNNFPTTQHFLMYDSETDDDETGLSTEGNNPKLNGISLARKLLTAASEDHFNCCREMLQNPETNLRYSGRQTEGISVMMHLFDNFMRNSFRTNQNFNPNHTQHEEIFQLALQHPSFTMMRPSKQHKRSFLDDAVDYGLNEVEYTKCPATKAIFIAGVLRGLVQDYKADPDKLHQETKKRLEQSCNTKYNRNAAFSSMLMIALYEKSTPLSPQRAARSTDLQTLAIWPRPTTVPNAQAAAERSTITEPAPLLTQPALPNNFPTTQPAQ